MATERPARAVAGAQTTVIASRRQRAAKELERLAANDRKFARRVT